MNGKPVAPQAASPARFVSFAHSRRTPSKTGTQRPKVRVHRNQRLAGILEARRCEFREPAQRSAEKPMPTHTSRRARVPMAYASEETQRRRRVPLGQV